MDEQILLVDKYDHESGYGEKLAVHKTGKLHRAFSIFIFNKNKELLLQQRALTKYHSPGIWTNTCCSHQHPGETIDEAAHRRLQEEMGFDTALVPAFTFTYKVAFSSGLTEHEFDHVYFGRFDGSIQPNATEVESYRWISLATLSRAIKQDPAKYSYWLITSFDKMKKEAEVFLKN